MATTETTKIPVVGTPEYWDDLAKALGTVKSLLWARLQHGAYQDDEEAKATFDAYWAVKKVQRLAERTMRQPALLSEEGP